MLLKKTYLFLLISILLLFGVSCSNQETGAKDHKGKQTTEESVELTVSAAISLTDALKEIEKEYTKDHPVTFKFNLGSSGTLAQQIQQGAPVDVFISANEDWMDELEKGEEIDAATRQDVTGNSIVFITQKKQPAAVKKITQLNGNNVKQIAIGNPESVPAGKYTKETLTNLNKWDDLQDSFIMAKDVRQVLTYVESGNADVGFVYGSDAKTSDKVTVTDTADQDLHAPIIYPAAVTKDSKHAKEAKDFIKYLESDEGQEKLEKYGFQKP